MTARAKPKRTIRVQQRHRKRTAPLPETWATRARHSNWLFGIEMAAIAAALVGIFLTAFAFRTQLEINKEEALAREQEAIARSWELITRRASGNSGKVRALEYLASQGQVLSGIDLSCATMGGTELDAEGAETCARRTFLRGLNLSAHTHGEPVSLHNADLSGAELKDADLSGARLSRADLSGADLMGADLSGVLLSDTDLSRAWLWGVDLSGAVLKDANLTGATLLGADLSGAELGGANLSHANLQDADFSGAELLGADLSGAWLWGTELSGENLRFANLSGARLWEADLSGADLWKADLSGVLLSDAVLRNAHLSRAIFTGAQNFASADFTDAWAWAGHPPIDLPISIDLCVQPPDWSGGTRPDPCVPPDPGE